MKKIIKTITIIIIAIMLNFAIFSNTVNALEQQQISIYTKGNFDRFLKYDGVLIKTANAVYAYNGKEYPAYCLNRELTGVGDKIESYEITNQGKITDEGLWKVIINGYPYKSFEQLGVMSEDEAYTATKQSIYCYIYNRDTSGYEGINEAGERTINAMRTILENARNSTESLENQIVKIIGDEKWKEENELIIKNYKLESDINISKYVVQLEDIPEGTIIIDSNGNQRNEYNYNERFKVCIPIKSLNKSGSFKIKILTEMETKPIFFGQAPSEEYQNYALTAYTYEDIKTEKVDKYEKNDTKIIIQKQNEEKQNLKGAVFEIKDKDGKIITAETDENGTIELNQIMPGKYLIKEIKAPEGYELNQETAEITVKLNEKRDVIINNKRIIIETPKITEEEKPQILEKPVQEVKKLPVTGM